MNMNLTRMNLPFWRFTYALSFSLCAFLTINAAAEDIQLVPEDSTEIVDLFSTTPSPTKAAPAPTRAEARPQNNDEPINIKFTPQPIAAPGNMWIRGDGNPVTLENYRGKWVVLNLWATWCMPCVAEMPTLDKLHRRYSKAGLEVIAINVNGSHGGGRIGLEDIRSFYRRAGVRYLPVHIDPQDSILPSFAAKRLPTTYLINPDGMIFGVVDGAEDWFSPSMQQLAERMIKTKPQPTVDADVVDLFAK